MTTNQSEMTNEVLGVCVCIYICVCVFLYLSLFEEVQGYLDVLESMEPHSAFLSGLYEDRE